MSPVTQTHTDQSRGRTAAFEREAEEVFQALRPSLAGILEELRPPVHRAAELGRALGLDKSLSWSVFSAATASDARALASLPGRRAMERFFAAAASRGVRAETIGRARGAFERFEAMVARHARSREVFGAMLAGSGSAAEEAGALDLKHKRTAFRSNALLWGRHVRVSCGAYILHPSAREGTLDVALIKGMVEVQQTRRSAPLHMVTCQWREALAADREANVGEPLDPRETGPGALGLLRDFCSQPVPEFRLRERGEGYASYELVSSDLGAMGEVTYFIGEVWRGDTASPASSKDAEVVFAKGVSIPTETYVGDILVHKGCGYVGTPEVAVYAYAVDGSSAIQEANLLPLTERVEYLGEGIDAARTPLLPRHTELLGYAMDRLGWREGDFRVYRCRVEYPILYTWIRMSLK